MNIHKIFRNQDSLSTLIMTYGQYFHNCIVDTALFESETNPYTVLYANMDVHVLICNGPNKSSEHTIPYITSMHVVKLYHIHCSVFTHFHNVR